MKSFTFVAWFVALALVICPPLAFAQGSTQEDGAMEEARALFMAGDAAARSERWADAYQNFVRAYELSGNPIAQFNAAFALRSLGRYREARDSLDTLLRDELPDELRSRVQTMRDEVVARLGRLVLQGLEEGLSYDLRVDGRRVADSGERPLSLDLDSGERNLVVSTPQARPFEWSGFLRAGQTLQIPVRLEPRADLTVRRDPSSEDPRLTTTDPAEAEEDDSGTVFESPVFWTIVGVVAIGAGVGTFILLNSGETLDPESNRVRNL